MKNYKEQVDELCLAIDIAIMAMKLYPPDFVSEKERMKIVEYTEKTFLEHRNYIQRHIDEMNRQSIISYRSIIFSYFQESSGKAVEYFWNEIKRNNLPIKRVNKLKKVLKRGKIKNQNEFDYVEEVLEPFFEDGTINNDECNLLRNMIIEFSKKR